MQRSGRNFCWEERNDGSVSDLSWVIRGYVFSLEPGFGNYSCAIPGESLHSLAVFPQHYPAVLLQAWKGKVGAAHSTVSLIDMLALGIVNFTCQGARDAECMGASSGKALKS